MPNISIALSLIALASGIWLLYKTQKENLSILYKVVAWVIIVVALLNVICCGIRCICPCDKIQQGCCVKQSCGVMKGCGMKGKGEMNCCMVAKSNCTVKKEGCCVKAASSELQNESEKDTTVNTK